MVDQHTLVLRLVVEGETKVLQAQKDYQTLDEVLDVLTTFLEQFGLPDRGPQTITFSLKSRRIMPS